MKKREILCENCEAEFYIETEDEVEYCVTCGEALVDYDYGEDETLYDED